MANLLVTPRPPNFLSWIQAQEDEDEVCVCLEFYVLLQRFKHYPLNQVTVESISYSTSSTSTTLIQEQMLPDGRYLRVYRPTLWLHFHPAIKKGGEWLRMVDASKVISVHYMDKSNEEHDGMAYDGEFTCVYCLRVGYRFSPCRNPICPSHHGKFPIGRCTSCYSFGWAFTPCTNSVEHGFLEIASHSIPPIPNYLIDKDKTYSMKKSLQFNMKDYGKEINVLDFIVNGLHYSDIQLIKKNNQYTMVLLSKEKGNTQTDLSCLWSALFQYTMEFSQQWKEDKKLAFLSGAYNDYYCDSDSYSDSDSDSGSDDSGSDVTNSDESDSLSRRDSEVDSPTYLDSGNHRNSIKPKIMLACIHCRKKCPKATLPCPNHHCSGFIGKRPHGFCPTCTTGGFYNHSQCKCGLLVTIPWPPIDPTDPELRLLFE